MSELAPVFIAQVELDGLDWPPTMTENADAALRAALGQMVADGLIIGFTLRVQEDVTLSPDAVSWPISKRRWETVGS